MTYKGSNWTRGELGNVPDPDPTIRCDEPTCDAATNTQDSDGWLKDANPEVPLLCPDCRESVSDIKKTPTDERREQNRTLGEWSE
jgi:hypothetical protein